MIIECLVAASFAATGLSAAETAALPAVSSAVVSAANRRFSALCAREKLDVDALLSDPALRSDLEACSVAEGRDLMEYAACRALQGAPGGCSALEGLGGGLRGGAADCRLAAEEDRFVFAALRGGDALPACRAHLALDGRRGPSVDKECPRMIALVRSEAPRVSCESLQRARLAASPEECEDVRVFWSGEARDCDAHFKDEVSRRFCRARAALAAGAREPAKCASSPFCQALASKFPGACEPLRATFSRNLCARVARDIAAEPRRAARELELRRQAEAQLKEKGARLAAQQAAAAAALKAKAEAADAKAKAELEAEKKKVAKQAAEQAAKSAAAAAAVKAKADAEAKKAADAKARIAKQNKPQFAKGAPMQATPPEASEIIKALEEGRPLPKPKPKPKKAAEEGEAPSEP